MRKEEEIEVCYKEKQNPREVRRDSLIEEEEKRQAHDKLDQKFGFTLEKRVVVKNFKGSNTTLHTLLVGPTKE